MRSPVMIETPRPVVFDCVVVKEENCYPMIPSGAAHYEMLLGPEARVGKPISEEGMRSEEHTSELQSLMRISYAVFCLKKQSDEAGRWSARTGPPERTKT